MKSNPNFAENLTYNSEWTLETTLRGGVSSLITLRLTAPCFRGKFPSGFEILIQSKKGYSKYFHLLGKQWCKRRYRLGLRDLSSVFVGASCHEDNIYNFYLEFIIYLFAQWITLTLF